MPHIAAHIVGTPPSGIRRVAEIAMARPGSIMLAIGEPSAAVAPSIREADVRAWEEGETRYSGNGGIPALRQAIVDKLARENDLHVSEDQVWVTIGATQALHQAMALVLSPGDEILVPDPGYTTFTMNAHMLSARAVPYRMPAAQGFLPDVNGLDAFVTDRTRAIIINTPSNPLGVTFDRATLEALVAFAERHDVWILSDEVYERFTWGVPHVSVASLPGAAERTLSVFSLSKTYAMTGIRVGWLVTPPGVASVMYPVQEAAIGCVNTPAQYAAIAALSGSQEAVEAAAATYREHFDAAAAVLTERGFDFLTPTGAFYLWVDMRHATGGDVAAWALRFLDEQRVAVAPGSAFGVEGEGWIRLSLASALEDLLEGIRRLPVPTEVSVIAGPHP